MPIGNDDINIWYCYLFFVRLLVVLVLVVLILEVLVLIVDLCYDVTIVINDLLLLDWF